MRQATGILFLGMLAALAGRDVEAACNQDLKTTLTAQLQNEGECPNGEEHCRVGKLLGVLIDNKLYGTSTGYVQGFKQCMANNGADGCSAPADKTIDPAHGFVLITLATDPSYVAAKGTPELSMANGVYQCVNELLGDVLSFSNVIELPRVAIPPPAGTVSNAGNGAGGGGAPSGMECKSQIFDCSKPLAFLPLPIGKFCSSSQIDMGKQQQLLLISGTDATMALDLRTLKAVACKDQVQPKVCGKDADVTIVGSNPDGSSHMAIIDGNSLVNPVGTFQKMMTTAKPLLEVLSKPVTMMCADAFKEAQADFVAKSFKIPGTETVVHKGKSEAVEVAQGVLRDKQAFLVLKSKATKALLGIGVLTIGDSADATRMNFKPFPDGMGGYTTVKEVALTSSDVAKARMILELGTEAVTCDVPQDDNTPLTCDLQNKIVSDPADANKIVKTMVAAKLKQQARNELGSESFGHQLGEVMVDNAKADPTQFLHLIMHGFEGFGQVPNALMMDPSGNRLYRQGSDGKAFLDPEEVLPGASNGCVLADLDNYGGRDLICFVDNMVYFVPKRNLAPLIGDVTVGSKLGASVKTQEGEDLTYNWSLYEVKDGALVNHSDLLSNTSSATPELYLNVEGASPGTIKAIRVEGVDLPNITINAALTKSVGVKASVDVPASGYFAVLTVKDAGGMSDTVIIPIATKGAGLGATTPPLAPPALPDPGKGAPSSAFGLQGGCNSMMPNAPSSNVFWVLLVPAFLSRIFRARFRQK